MLGFLHISDLYPRKSWDSHECLLMTYRASPGYRFGPAFLFSWHVWEEGAWGHLPGIMAGKREMELLQPSGGGWSLHNIYLQGL